MVYGNQGVTEARFFSIFSLEFCNLELTKCQFFVFFFCRPESSVEGVVCSVRQKKNRYLKINFAVCGFLLIFAVQ